MARFFFDSDDGERLVRDRLGVEVSTLEEVAREAAGLLRDLANHDLFVGQRTLATTVRDAGGMPVYRATMTITGTALLSHEVSTPSRHEHLTL